MRQGDIDKSSITSFLSYIYQQNQKLHELEVKLKIAKRQRFNQRTRLEETIKKKMKKPEIVITEASLLMGAKIVSIGDSVMDRFKQYEAEREELADKLNTLVAIRNRIIIP